MTPSLGRLPAKPKDPLSGHETISYTLPDANLDISRPRGFVIIIVIIIIIITIIIIIIIIKNVVFPACSGFPVKLICCTAFPSASSACYLRESIAINL